jgi:hypothetical protein
MLGNVSFNPDPEVSDTWNVRTGTLSCGAGSAGTSKRHAPIISALDYDTSTCNRQYIWADRNHGNAALAQQEYDTARAFIESCAQFEWSWRAFGWASGAVDYLKPYNSIYLQYRDWLKSVVFLSPSDRYYCADLGAIYYTFARYIGPNGHDYNAAIAILDYIVRCGRCDSAGDWATRQSLRDEQWLHYRDTVRDSIANPLDTTLPSLDALGLGLLTVKEHGYAARPDILHLSASQNPFDRVTELTFELSEIDVASIEVFDVLGNRVFNSERRVYEPGTQDITIDLSGSGSGTYYARLTTAHGDTRTVKLVKK